MGERHGPGHRKAQWKPEQWRWDPAPPRQYPQVGSLSIPEEKVTEGPFGCWLATHVLPWSPQVKGSKHTELADHLWVPRPSNDKPQWRPSAESNIKLKGNSQSGRQKNVCINISISISEIMKQELDAMKKEHSEQLRALGNMATCISRIEGETTQKLVELKSEETKNKSGRTWSYQSKPLTIWSIKVTAWKSRKKWSLGT